MSIFLVLVKLGKCPFHVCLFFLFTCFLFITFDFVGFVQVVIMSRSHRSNVSVFLSPPK